MRVNGARRTSDGTSEDTMVAVGIKEDAVGHVPVSAGPPCFPVVVFHGLGQKGVDHVPHVRLVDAHTKGCAGGTDDLPMRYGLLVLFSYLANEILQSHLKHYSE